jgi:hypothetical protein
VGAGVDVGASAAELDADTTLYRKSYFVTPVTLPQVNVTESPNFGVATSFVIVRQAKGGALLVGVLEGVVPIVAEKQFEREPQEELSL